MSEGQEVTIDNKFPFEVTVSWVLLPVTSSTTGQIFENPFRFSPQSSMVPANGSFTFQVRFAPFEPDSYFF